MWPTPAAATTASTIVRPSRASRNDRARVKWPTMATISRLPASREPSRTHRPRSTVGHMGLVAQSGPGLARAGGVALVLPLALVGGLALTVAIGGNQQLRALRQGVAGPEAPVAAKHGERDLAAAVRVPPLRVSPSVTGLPTPRVTTSAPVRRRVNTSPRPGARRPSSPPARPSPPPATATPTPTPQPSPPPASPPAQPSNPVQSVGQQVSDTAKKNLPSPVGPVAGDTVKTVVDLIAPPGIVKKGVAPPGQTRGFPPGQSGGAPPGKAIGLTRETDQQPQPWAPSLTHSPQQPPGASPTSSRG